MVPEIVGVCASNGMRYDLQASCVEETGPRVGYPRASERTAMSPNPESLLEVNRIDEVIEAPDPPQTVVVVQYRTGRLPWVLLMGVVLTIPLIGYAIYYRTNQGLRDQAAWAARAEVKRLEEQKRLEAEQRAPIRSEPPVAPASTSLSTVPAPGSVAGNSGSDPPKVEAIAPKPVESTAAGQPSAVVGAAARPAGTTTFPAVAAVGSTVSPPIPSPRGLDSVAVVKAPADAARSPFDDADPPSTDPADTPFGGTASRTSAIAQPSPGAALPAQTRPNPTRPRPESNRALSRSTRPPPRRRRPTSRSRSPPRRPCLPRKRANASSKRKLHKSAGEPPRRSSRSRPTSVGCSMKSASGSTRSSERPSKETTVRPGWRSTSCARSSTTDPTPRVSRWPSIFGDRAKPWRTGSTRSASSICPRR